MQLFNKRTSGSILTSGKLFFTKKVPSRQARGFTMMELVIVIVVIGLLSKYGVEFMTQAYKGFIFSKINNELQNKSTTAIEFISKRLSYRIKDSVIARKADGSFTSIQDAVGEDYTTLEWVGSDIDGFRGDKYPKWSGIIDVRDGNASNLVSPDTNTSAVIDLIRILSNDSTRTLADSAIYFVGSNSDITTSYGWDGTAIISQQNAAMHPITTGTNLTDFSSSLAVDFNGTDVYEYYKLAWTAYAIELAADGNLTLYYDYQPWNGERFTTATNVKSSLIMQNVDTFQFRSIGSLIKIQVCVKSPLTGEEYSICKEKTVY